MAINVTAAIQQANNLYGNIDKLRAARQNLVAYKEAITANWQGEEVGYYISAIDQVVGEINAAMGNIESLTNDIKTVAAQIQREEQAAAAAATAAAAAKAAKQARVTAAQNEYNKAYEELEKLLEAQEKLKKELRKASGFMKAALKSQLSAMDALVARAQDVCNNKLNALNAARK